MCLRYPPTIVACVCIHLACKWSNYVIPSSTEGKPWFQYVDGGATQPLLEKLTNEFLNIFEKCPSRLKKKIMASTEAVSDLLSSWLRDEMKRSSFGFLECLAIFYWPIIFDIIWNSYVFLKTSQEP